MKKITNSKYGLAFKAIGQNLDAARASGYIDWEAVGREMAMSGWIITGKGFAVLIYK